ncbi:MAG: hypothetical protein LUC19_07675 [Oscillospiraceae bacterium]|nr:hypothetical protein [Oscillospiraceae bacterium]MCD8344244.1 hypothetical protein [Oscillospiraceae bacterium]
MTLIKINGITEPPQADWLNEIAPNYVGFRFAENCQNCVAPPVAADIRAALDSSISSVGIFRDQPGGLILELHRRGVIGTAELDGDETENYIIKLRDIGHMPIFKLYPLSMHADIMMAARCPADILILKMHNPENLSWDDLPQHFRPYIMHTEQTPEAVAEAAAKYKPFCIELEMQDDLLKMNELVAAARG